jgi:preprotein translocase subunit SecG
MNWIGLTITLLKIATVFVSILLVFIVLLQRPRSEGLGAAFGGDTASNLLGAQASNVLATVTRWLGGIFLALCLLIAFLGTKDRDQLASIDQWKATALAEKEKRDKEAAAQKEAEENTRKAQEAAELEKIKAATPPVKPGEEGKPSPVPTPAPSLENKDGKPAQPAPPQPAPSQPGPAAPASEKPTTPPGPPTATPASPTPTTPAGEVPKPAEPAKPTEPVPAPAGENKPTPPPAEPAKPADEAKPAENAPKPPQ